MVDDEHGALSHTRVVREGRKRKRVLVQLAVLVSVGGCARRCSTRRIASSFFFAAVVIDAGPAALLALCRCLPHRIAGALVDSQSAYRCLPRRIVYIVMRILTHTFLTYSKRSRR